MIIVFALELRIMMPRLFFVILIFMIVVVLFILKFIFLSIVLS